MVSRDESTADLGGLKSRSGKNARLRSSARGDTAMSTELAGAGGNSWATSCVARLDALSASMVQLSSEASETTEPSNAACRTAATASTSDAAVRSSAAIATAQVNAVSSRNRRLI